MDIRRGEIHTSAGPVDVHLAFLLWPAPPFASGWAEEMRVLEVRAQQLFCSSHLRAYQSSCGFSTEAGIPCC
jgi:hypothetical protein